MGAGEWHTAGDVFPMTQNEALAMGLTFSEWSLGCGVDSSEFYRQYVPQAVRSGHHSGARHREAQAEAGLGTARVAQAGGVPCSDSMGETQ